MDRRHSSASNPGVKLASYILGIDIGTTSVKVCLVNTTSRDVSLKNVKDTMANIPSELGVSGDKQDVNKIYGALHSCISKIPKDQLRRVVHIALCGQMHGVMFWKDGEGWIRNARDQVVVGPTISGLYTWQDGRCSTEFLASLPHPTSHLSLNSGYGCATMFWHLKNKPEYLQNFDRCGTVMDFVSCMMLDLSEPVTSDQNAASFGFFDCISMQWNHQKLENASFPINMLPKVVRATENAGVLPRDWFDIPAGTPVSAAMGDLQCSVKSTLEDMDTDSVINLSTSAQIAFVKPEGFQPENSNPCDPRSPVEFFPYIEGRYIAVAASLTGGNALAAFVKMIQSWCVELGCNLPQSKIWSAALASGMKEAETPTLDINPTIFGERHSPDQKGTVRNINQGNIGLGQVTRSVCKGIIANLASMMTPEMLKEGGIKRIVGSGACLIRNQVLQREIKELYKIPVHFVEEGNACIGAAMAIGDRHHWHLVEEKKSKRTRTVSYSEKNDNRSSVF